MPLARFVILAVEPAAEPGLFARIGLAWVDGGWGMYPIAFFLLIGLAITAERVVALFFTAAVDKEALLRGLRRHIFAGDLEQAINYLSGLKRTPLTTVLKAGLMSVPNGEEEVQAALDEASLRENPKLEARTGYLAMLGNAAMLAGLLGTVDGLIGSFRAVAVSTPSDRATILAGSIGEAMNCTRFGLIAAIPMLIMFSVLNGRTQTLINDLNEVSVATLNLIVQNRDKLKNVKVPVQDE